MSHSVFMEQMQRPISSMKKYMRPQGCDCGRKINGAEYFRPHVNDALIQCCRECFEIEAAELEADDEGRRWTAISSGTQEYHCYYGNRCACGCTKPASLEFCVKCWKEYRMLGKHEADIKFNRRLINQLKEMARDGKKH